jgi:hypothetical protein
MDAGTFFNTYRRQIIIGFVVLIIAIIGFSMVTYISRIGKVGTTFSIVPTNARITIDGAAGSQGTTWLQPGDYTVNVTHPGFTSREKRITVTADKKQNVVAISLTPESDEAKKWAEQNDDQYKKNEEFGAIEARQTGEFMRAKYPIIKSIPYEDPYFKIAYKIENNDSITLTIDTQSPRYRYFAVQKIRELGYDPTDYTIEFSDFRNPLDRKDV